MTEETRDAYFNFQDGLRIVLQKRDERWPFGNLQFKSTEAPDLTEEEKDDIERVKEHLRPNEDWTIPEEVIGLINDTGIGRDEDNVPNSVFDKLRKLGSSLRTNMSNDVLTRRGSVLHEQDRLESDGSRKDVPA